MQATTTININFFILNDGNLNFPIILIQIWDSKLYFDSFQLFAGFFDDYRLFILHTV